MGMNSPSIGCRGWLTTRNVYAERNPDRLSVTGLQGTRSEKEHLGAVMLELHRRILSKKRSLLTGTGESLLY
jgi:hypothetical protein